MTADGSRAYVTDLLSGEVSVIDTDPNSPTFNTELLPRRAVGVGPWGSGGTTTAVMARTRSPRGGWVSETDITRGTLAEHAIG